MAESDEAMSTNTNPMNRNKWFKRIHSFEDMNLRILLLRGVYGYGCEHPSEIQRLAVVPCTLGRDVLLQSQSGTGKTFAWIVSVLQRLDMNIKDCQTLVITPTREIAHGIQHVIATVGHYMDVTSMASLASVNPKIDLLKIQAGVQILVSTPGRSSVLLKYQPSWHEQIKTLVLEDIEEMLSRGFQETLSDVLNMLPRSIQLIIISSSISPPVNQFIEQFMKNPIHAHWENPQFTLQGVRQFYVSVRNTEEKMEVLLNLLDVWSPERMIIFCNRRNDVHALLAKMSQYSDVTAALVGDTNDADRQLIFTNFRTGGIRIIVSSDTRIDYEVRRLASIKINYDLPISIENYLFRSGNRTNSRFTPRSVSIALVTDADTSRLRAIENFHQTEISELPQDVSDLI